MSVYTNCQIHEIQSLALTHLQIALKQLESSQVHDFVLTQMNSINADSQSYNSLIFELLIAVKDFASAQTIDLILRESIDYIKRYSHNKCNAAHRAICEYTLAGSFLAQQSVISELILLIEDESSETLLSVIYTLTLLGKIIEEDQHEMILERINNTLIKHEWREIDLSAAKLGFMGCIIPANPLKYFNVLSSCLKSIHHKIRLASFEAILHITNSIIISENPKYNRTGPINHNLQNLNIINMHANCTIPR